jgi:multiple sugar transport system permease protein
MRRILPHVGLAVFSLYILLPFAWTLRTSVVPEKLAYAPALFPSLTFDNYLSIISRGFGGALANSLILAGGSTLLALPFAASIAYAFARFNTGGKSARFIVLATQMLPAVVLVLPVFSIFRDIGMTNSLYGLIIVYASLNLPFLTWILLGFFEGIPSDLESAAMVDGATPLQAFLMIVQAYSASSWLGTSSFLPSC